MTYGRTKISLEAFESILHASLEERYRSYAGALVSFAYAPEVEDGAEYLFSCRWEFVDAEAPVRPRLTYPALVIEETWFPITGAVRELLRVLRAETALGGCKLRKPVSEIDIMDSSRETFTGWRESAFEASLGRAYASDQTPVVAKGLRPYPSIALAVNEWVWRQRNARGMLPYFDLGKLRVLLPDTRGRIREANWVDRVLTVKSDRNVDSDEVELQAVVIDQHTALMLPSRPVEPEVTWDVPVEADGIELYLVHRDGTLLSHEQLKRGTHFDVRPGHAFVQERAEKELRDGEGERVEFKPFTFAEDAKEQQIIRTVVAFSNTSGGRIYVGVEDDGTPQGVVGLRKVGRRREEESLDNMKKRIEKLIRENTKPDPDVRVTPVRVLGAPLIVVDVVAGENAPYSTSGNEILIRSGASNRRPDPQTELPAVRERALERRERRERQERWDALAASSYQKGDD